MHTLYVLLLTQETLIGIVISYLLLSLFCKWVLSWGGAAVLHNIQGNWLGGLLLNTILHFFTWSDNEEGIRLAALGLWIVGSVLFAIYIGWYLMQG